MDFKELKILFWRDYYKTIRNPEEEYWVKDYREQYQSSMETIDHILELLEQLRSKKRGKKSKDKAANKIQRIYDNAKIPRRDDVKWDPIEKKIILPPYNRFVKAVYKDYLQLVRELHSDRKSLEHQGVRRLEEIYKGLSERVYWFKYGIEPTFLPEPGPDETLRPIEFLLRYGMPWKLSKRITFEEFEELMVVTPREGAIALTAKLFGIKEDTVRKKI